MALDLSGVRRPGVICIFEYSAYSCSSAAFYLKINDLAIALT